MFAGLKISFIRRGTLTKGLEKILTTKIRSHGGEVLPAEKLTDANVCVTGYSKLSMKDVVAEDKVKPFHLPEDIKKACSSLETKADIVFHDWISQSLQHGYRASLKKFKAPLTLTVSLRKFQLILHTSIYHKCKNMKLLSIEINMKYCGNIDLFLFHFFRWKTKKLRTVEAGKEIWREIRPYLN